MIGRSTVTRLLIEDLKKLRMYELMDALDEQNMLLNDQYESLSGLGQFMVRIKDTTVIESKEEREAAAEKMDNHMLDTIVSIAERLDIINSNIDNITVAMTKYEKVGDLND